MRMRKSMRADGTTVGNQGVTAVAKEGLGRNDPAFTGRMPSYGGYASFVWLEVVMTVVNVTPGAGAGGLEKRLVAQSQLAGDANIAHQFCVVCWGCFERARRGPWFGVLDLAYSRRRRMNIRRRSLS